jgi:hypothetical protein
MQAGRGSSRAAAGDSSGSRAANGIVQFGRKPQPPKPKKLTDRLKDTIAKAKNSLDRYQAVRDRNPAPKPANNIVPIQRNN